MPEPLRIGLAGLGTVGAGVVGCCRRTGRPSPRAPGGRWRSPRSRRGRGTATAGSTSRRYGWEDDPVALARRGGRRPRGRGDGRRGRAGARPRRWRRIAGGKHLVTANKAMLARHGQALAEAAEAAGVALRFEAAVAGGIPVVKALTEGLAGNAITRLMGVLNGTCNYILTRMEAEDAPYAAGAGGGAAARLRRGRSGLRRRRDRRGAEAGAARRHRLRHAGSTSTGSAVEGIERVSLADIEHAAELGYRIRLLGVARMTRGGARGADAALPGAGGLAARAARPASPTWW